MSEIATNDRAARASIPEPPDNHITLLDVVDRSTAGQHPSRFSAQDQIAGLLGNSTSISGLPADQPHNSSAAIIPGSFKVTLAGFSSGVTTLDVPTPEVTIPNFTLPDVTIPDVPMPGRVLDLASPLQDQNADTSLGLTTALMPGSPGPGQLSTSSPSIFAASDFARIPHTNTEVLYKYQPWGVPELMMAYQMQVVGGPSMKGTMLPLLGAISTPFDIKHAIQADTNLGMVKNGALALTDVGMMAPVIGYLVGSKVPWLGKLALGSVIAKAALDFIPDDIRHRQ